MDKNQPINFINNHFIFLEGRREYFNGEKEFTTMPYKEKLKVNNNNIWNSIKEIFIPISQITANIKRIQYANNIVKEDCIPYDLETDDKENFVLGYVGDKKFTDAKEMVKELQKHKIVYGFNIYKFDNEILHKYSPESFIEVKNKDFIAHTLNGVIMLDLFAIIRVIVGLESYSAESLAKNKGFNKEIPSYEDKDKDEKCKVDIEINQFLLEKYNIIEAFNTISTLANIDLTLMQVIPGERLRKWILINKYLRNNLLPLKTDKSRSDKTDFGIMRLDKPGFYEDYKYLDISSTYPQTAVNFGNLGIYKEDNMFSEMQKELLELSKNQNIKPYTKSISNALCGIQYSLNEYWRNDDVFEKIVTTVANKVREVSEQRKDIVYIHTDCFVIPKDSPDIKIEGYSIKTDYEFSELYVYNGNKWLGKTKDRIEFRGFKKLNSKNPKILHLAREEILTKLKKLKGDDFKEALEEPEKLVKKVIKNLEKYDKEYFKIKIRKQDESCWDMSLMDIWKELPLGFTDIYYKDYQKHTTNPKNINYKYYEKLILELVNEYNPLKE